MVVRFTSLSYVRRVLKMRARAWIRWLSSSGSLAGVLYAGPALRLLVTRGVGSGRKTSGARAGAASGSSTRGL